jgi:hypothetical protein
MSRLTKEDRRGLTPLLFGHVNPYGSFRLDMSTRLPLDPVRIGPICRAESSEVHSAADNKTQDVRWCRGRRAGGRGGA